jgi:hypothetical protein
MSAAILLVRKIAMPAVQIQAAKEKGGAEAPPFRMMLSERN